MGGWLAIEYLCRGASGLAGLVLASTSASMPQFIAETNRLIDELSEPHRSVLRHSGAQLRYREPEYLASAQEFYRRHLCRLDPWPAVLSEGMAEEANNQSYSILSGPNDLIVTGRLRQWDRAKDLGHISTPTLVTCGRYDAITPACSQAIVAGVPLARLVVFEESAHVAHIEEANLYAATVTEFLASVDNQRDAS